MREQIFAPGEVVRAQRLGKQPRCQRLMRVQLGKVALHAGSCELIDALAPRDIL